MAKRFLIYFTTDIHGSEVCFRKFLNAGKFYGAQVLLLGGDVTGKMIVPIVRGSDGRMKCNWLGQSYEPRGDEEVKRLVTTIRACGHYPYVIEEQEYALLDTREKMDAKFVSILRASLAEWAQLAEDRLKGSGIRCLIAPGNDDLSLVDEVLSQCPVIENPEGRVTELDGIHELIATGYSNPTPWNTERELAEEALEEQMECLFSKLRDPSHAIASLHAPPYDSGLDMAPALKDLKVQTSGGQPLLVAVGSKAVRHVIEKHQPQVGLHGHIHESRAIAKVGRTICINPGSEYTEGILNGALIGFEKEKLVTWQLVAG